MSHANAPAGTPRHAAILVTGAGGEMGHGLLERLAARARSRGQKVLALDVRELPADTRPLVDEALVGDIGDLATLERLLAGHELAEVFHLAALLSTRGESAPETAHAVNVVGTVNLLRLSAEAARLRGKPVRFLFPSSIAAYGISDLATKAKAGRVHEGQFLEPQTMYGVNKLEGEHLGRYYARHYRALAKDRMPNPIDFRSIRFPGIISADTVPTGGTSDFGPEMLHAAAAGKPYACFVRSDSRIPFMTMPDAIEALLGLAEAPVERLSRQVYNVGAFSLSAAEFAERVQAAFPDARTSFAPDLARQGIVDSWPEDVDDAAARRDWGWKPAHDADAAFRDYLLPRIRARYAVPA